MRSLILPSFLLVTACAAVQADELELPASITFGEDLDVMTPVFEDLCAGYIVRTLDPAELPIAERSHVQVDCQDFEHAGDSRLAEFVFADDRLAFIWVLTDASEEAELRITLEGRFGSPTHDTPAFIAFADDHMALRRDTPELLYYSAEIAPMYRAWFDQMAAQ